MLFIDRFEGDYALVEYDEGKTFSIPRNLLPSKAKEGDVITMVITVEEDATGNRRKTIERLMDDLFE